MRSELLEHAREYGTNALTSAEEYGESAMETVEDTVAGIPANALLTAGFASIGVALALKLSGRDADAKFVGQWAPTFIGLAVFSKLSKRPKPARRK